MSDGDDPIRAASTAVADAVDVGAAATLRTPAGPVARPPDGARFGRFVVEGALGAGGMGVVLAARDPELDRRVALKVLRPEVVGNDLAQARLTREAQAMAKLSHPNVVTVYDVGRTDSQVFLAMELVEGVTLRAWLDQRPRTWREVVAMFVAAGRGLAAAHAAGLVHRDFKPQNVLVGSDGRPRVTDFGLVGGGRVDDADPFRGSAVGTPAYMSAEQWDGGVVDARSDQFAFCVAMWEGVYGVHPLTARLGPDLAGLVDAGVILAPPAARGAPGWLETALRRGLARVPAERWPSMSGLLEDLERRAGGNRRVLRIAGVIAVAVTAGVAVAAIASFTRGASPPVCPSPDARVDPVWGPARRAALRAALLQIDPALGAARLETAAATFDPAAADWRRQHVAACTATRVEGRQSDTMLDLRMRCLDRWLRELDGTVGLLAHATSREQLDDAIVAVTRMSPLSDCADTAALGARPPPASAEDRAEAQAIEDELDAIALTTNAGDLDLPRARAVVERARALAHPPTLAAALHWLAVVANGTEDGSRRDVLDELTRAAAIAADDRLAAFAWVGLIEAHGAELDHPERADAILASAETALLRAGDPPHLRFELLRSRAGLLGDAGRATEAAALLDQAERVLDDADPARLPRPVEDYRGQLLFARARLLDSTQDFEGAIAMFREAIAVRTRLLGADHPEVTRALMNVGELLRELDRLDEAGLVYDDAVRILESRVGESAVLAMALNRRGSVYLAKHQPELALPLFERAAAIGERTLGPEHPRHADLLTDIGQALQRLDRIEDALAMFDRSLAINERGGQRSTNVAIAHFNRGNVHTLLGHWDQAAVDHRRAVAIMEENGVDQRYLVSFLFAVGRDLVNGGKPAEAIEPLERALSTPGDGGQEYRAMSRYMLGRARVDSGRDRTGGLAQARRARAEVVALGAVPEVLAEIDAWLTRQ